VTGDDSPCGLASLGAIAQGAILPGEMTRLTDSPGGLASLGAIAQGAILPGGAIAHGLGEITP
jgi:hypothetical protein